MLLIGHSFHASDRHVHAAIASGDRLWLASLVQRQLRAGADCVDISAAGFDTDEGAILAWCVAVAESAGGRAVMIDSGDAELLCTAALACAHPPWLNSLQLVGKWPADLQGLLQSGCRAVVQLREGPHIPHSARERMRLCELAAQRCAAFPTGSVWVDAVALPWGSDLSAGRGLLEFLESAVPRWPQFAFLIGLSNLSYGHGDRSAIHCQWLPELRARGLQGALLDPFDPALMALAR